MGREDEIKLIAYSIWKEEGCREGQDCEHWLRAETIWEQKQKPRVASTTTKAESKPAVIPPAKVAVAKKSSPGTKKNK
jgi:hypothetical protein